MNCQSKYKKMVAEGTTLRQKINSGARGKKEHLRAAVCSAKEKLTSR